MIKVLFGPPGTGKSSRLIDILEDEMRTIEPDRIAFVSFTKKAVREVMERVIDQFRLCYGDFPYFKTLHSLAYKIRGLSRSEVMQKAHYKELGDLLGLDFSDGSDFENGMSTARYDGDLFLYIEGYARARGISPSDAWVKLQCDYELNWLAFDQYCRALKEYKEENGLVDFCDFLMNDIEPLDIDVAIIDEAQDLSTLQWQFALKAFSKAKRIYIAGDDDQAIYNWSGADVRFFLGIEGEQIILDQSHRIPRAVHAVAEDIAGRIRHRLPKKYMPRAEEGLVEYYRYLEDVDCSSGTWLVLARNTYHLARLSHLMKTNGWFYSYRGSSSVDHMHINAITVFEAWRKGYAVTVQEAVLVNQYMPEELHSNWPNTIWHEALTKIALKDREFYISMLRNGERINKEPRIQLNTIHSVKGGEAQNVLLLSDITTKTQQGMMLTPDNEHRTWYVGVTRCKESLHIILPQTRLFYDV